MFSLVFATNSLNLTHSVQKVKVKLSLHKPGQAPRIPGG